MAHEKFPVEVLTPEGEVFNDEVEMVSTRTGTGSIGVLAGHTPILAMLEPAELKLYKSESDVVVFAQGEGYMQVTGGRALLLVEEAHPPDQLNQSDLQDKLREAERAFEQAEDGSAEEKKARRDRDRWQRFLDIQGSH